MDLRPFATFAFVITICVSQGSPNEITQLVVFGDSHSDVGNLMGERFTNGLNWVDELAIQFGLPAPVPSTRGGANYAYGGARSGDGIDTLFQWRVPKVGEQIKTFLTDSSPNDTDLIVMFVGHNDLGWGNETDPARPVSNISEHVQTLAAAGATNFLISNLHPIGHLPAYRGGPTEQVRNDRTVAFNEQLPNAVDEPRNALDIDIYEVDLAALIQSVLEQPSSFGFSNVVDPASSSPGNDEEFLYWDGHHFTASFYRQLGKTAALTMMPGAPMGDFNNDGASGIADIDELTEAIASEDRALIYDLNDDRLLNELDRRHWVTQLKTTYFGDANLDLEFNSSDMVQVFNVGKYETGEQASWGEGDWNGDGIFGSDDMVTAFVDGGYEKGPRPPAVAVPEPTAAILLLCSLIVIAARRQSFDP